jgi:hypothetical protein
MPVPDVTFLASTAICSASSLVGDMMMPRMSSGLARLYPRVRSPSLGSCAMILWMTGMRKPRVLPVPVLAWAILGDVSGEGYRTGESVHVGPAQCFIDSASLDFRHGLQFHLLCDCIDNIRVHQSSSCEVLEPRDWTILCNLLTLLLGSHDLLPHRALMECSNGDIVHSQR